MVNAVLNESKNTVGLRAIQTSTDLDFLSLVEKIKTKIHKNDLKKNFT